MDFIATPLVNGLAFGVLLFLMSAGLTLVFLDEETQSGESWDFRPQTRRVVFALASFGKSQRSFA